MWSLTLRHQVILLSDPYETDQDFADTLRLVDEVKYASAYSFKYSERPGTPAANSGNQVDEGVKSERPAALSNY